jgi:hypothetical protein
MMQNSLRKSLFLAFAMLLALFPALAFAVVPVQSGSFTLSQHGKSVGAASFKFTTEPQGIASTSMVRVSMQGLEYSISKTERLSASSQLQHVQLSATVNKSAVTVVGAPDSPQVLLNISAKGRSSTTRLDAHPSAVFLPDFDPGALETLLTLAAAQNNRDLWAIIPKQAGTIEAITLATYADEKGTYNGKPVIVHHLVATIAGAATDLFSGPQNQLLQAEFPQQGFALVREGFILTPPAKPLAPPAQ